MRPERKKGTENNTKIILCGQIHTDPLPFKLLQQFIQKLINNGVKVVVAKEIPDDGPETLNSLIKEKENDSKLIEDIENLWPHFELSNAEFHKKLIGFNFKSPEMNFARTMTSVAPPSTVKAAFKNCIITMINTVCVIPKEFKDDMNFLKSRFISDRNSSKEISEVCKFIKDKKIEFIPLEDRALIAGVARESQYLNVSDQHTKEFVNKHEIPRIAHFKDALMKAYNKNQHAVIIVMNLGKAHVERLAANLMLSDVDNQNVTMLEFFPSDKMLPSIGLTKEAVCEMWKGTDRLRQYDPEPVQRLYSSMQVHKINPDCNSNKDRTITSKGGFEEIEEEILRQYVPTVRIELSGDFSEKETKQADGTIKNNILEIRADKLDKDVRDKLNLTKQKLNTSISDKQRELFEQNGIAAVKDNHNGVTFIVCDKSKLDVAKSIANNTYHQKDAIAGENQDQALTELSANSSDQAQKASPSPSPSLTKSENKDFPRPLTSSKEKSACERITGCSIS